jgi:glycosyltransferase involved in cell wall biosynthesis
VKGVRILNIAFALAYVGDGAVGGAEQVLAQLERGQVAAGHESLVVAAANSEVCGTLLGTVCAPDQITDGYYSYRYREHKQKIDEVMASGAIDVVHMHGYDFYEFVPDGDVPVLVTLHLPLSWYPQWIYRSQRKRVFMNCVSATQRYSAPDCPFFVRTIGNGVPITPIDPLPAGQRDGVVMLSRICPEKGIHLGISAARKAGVALTIAGRASAYPEHVAYFREQVIPALDHDTRFIGAIGHRQKTELLRSAKCLLLPSLAPETSSLVSMEALACGTPVVAMNSGALGEIVEQGKTGFLVDSVEEMAEAIHVVERIDPAICRRVAIERFSADRMVGEYLNLYERLVEGEEFADDAAIGRCSWQPGTSQSCSDEPS